MCKSFLHKCCIYIFETHHNILGFRDRYRDDLSPAMIFGNIYNFVPPKEFRKCYNFD
jgi:hypothetical protein